MFCAQSGVTFSQRFNENGNASLRNVRLYNEIEGKSLKLFALIVESE